MRSVILRIYQRDIKSGNDIYFCGCGATGRLSLTIETLWRQIHHGEAIENRVFSFMAGGDVALIRSIENFEDFPQYGARQLLKPDLKMVIFLIGTTEGGETPFVLAQLKKRLRFQRESHFSFTAIPMICYVKLLKDQNGLFRIPRLKR